MFQRRLRTHRRHHPSGTCGDANEIGVTAIHKKVERRVGRLVKGGTPIETSQTVHPLLPPAEMEWTVAAASDVTTTVGAGLIVTVT